MAITQHVIMPQRQEDSLDKLAKALNLLTSLYGISTIDQQTQLRDLQKQQAENELKKSQMDLENYPSQLATSKQEKELELAQKKRLSELTEFQLSEAKFNEKKNALGAYTPREIADNFVRLNSSNKESLISASGGLIPISTVNVIDPVKDTVEQIEVVDKKAYENILASINKTTDKKPPQNAYKAAGFADRMKQAEIELSMLENEGFNRANLKTSLKAGATDLLSSIGLNSFSQYLKSEDLKKFEQARRNWINANLRNESGATIQQSEFDNAELQYFPSAGDAPDVIRQKRENRIAALESMQREAGNLVNSDNSDIYALWKEDVAKQSTINSKSIMPSAIADQPEFNINTYIRQNTSPTRNYQNTTILPGQQTYRGSGGGTLLPGQFRGRK